MTKDEIMEKIKELSNNDSISFFFEKTDENVKWLAKFLYDNCEAHKKEDDEIQKMDHSLLSATLADYICKLVRLYFDYLPEKEVLLMGSHMQKHIINTMHERLDVNDIH